MELALLLINLVVSATVAGTILFGKEYLSSKATNLAKKEDIEKITRLVEGAKQDFRQEIEGMKASLNHDVGVRSKIADYQIRKYEELIRCSAQMAVLAPNLVPFVGSLTDDQKKELLDEFNELQAKFQTALLEIAYSLPKEAVAEAEKVSKAVKAEAIRLLMWLRSGDYPRDKVPVEEGKLNHQLAVAAHNHLCALLGEEMKKIIADGPSLPEKFNSVSRDIGAPLALPEPSIDKVVPRGEDVEAESKNPVE